MNEQIYINGIPMEQEDGQLASLVYQSPFFTDIDSIVSNRTNSVSFPRTKNNLAAIDDIHIGGVESVYAYRRHRVVYYRDGLQLFSGYGTLLAVTDKAIRFTFTWGNANAFKALLDLNMRDLKPAPGRPASPTHIDWNDTAPDVWPKYYPANMVTGGHRHPALPVKDLLEDMEAMTGVTIEWPDALPDYYVPLLSRRADARAVEAQGVDWRTGHLYSDTWGVVDRRFLADIVTDSTGENDSDPRHLYLGNGVIDVSEFQNLRVTVPSTVEIAVPKYDGYNVQRIAVYATDEDGHNAKLLTSFPLDRTASDGWFIYSTDRDRSYVVDVSEYKYVIVQVFRLPARLGIRPTWNEGWVMIVPDYDKEQELIYGGEYPLYYNLPDWTCSQFLKNLMKMSGVFAVCPDDRTVRFVSMADLYGNRRRAADITGTTVSTDETAFSFGSYGRRNWFRYADDKTVSTDADGFIDSDSELLDAEKDLVKLDFAASDERKGKIYVSLYTRGEDRSLNYSDVTPRILAASPDSPTEAGHPVLTFKGMDWPSLIEKNYRLYAATIKRPKVIKASILFDTPELSGIDLSVPVYSRSLGHHYAVLSLTTKGGKTADAELLQLGAADDAAPQTSEFVIQLLNEGSSHCITIPALPETEVRTMAGSGLFKLVLMRYGYTRRGKRRVRTDKITHATVTTHTDRDRSYKHERGGKKWRIIGMEELKTGAISPKSAAYRFYRGNGVQTTLVFDLLQDIVLPPLGKMDKTKAGRFPNPSSRGRSEIFAGLLRNTERGWRLCSNILQVRGRSDDKTKLWDFEKTNEIL